jgi:hypothetical protein
MGLFSKSKEKDDADAAQAFSRLVTAWNSFDNDYHYLICKKRLDGSVWTHDDVQSFCTTAIQGFHSLKDLAWGSASGVNKSFYTEWSNLEDKMRRVESEIGLTLEFLKSKKH